MASDNTHQMDMLFEKNSVSFADNYITILYLFYIQGYREYMHRRVPQRESPSGLTLTQIIITVSHQ
jgi:hypothetical protein